MPQVTLIVDQAEATSCYCQGRLRPFSEQRVLPQAGVAQVLLFQPEFLVMISRAAYPQVVAPHLLSSYYLSEANGPSGMEWNAPL